MKSKKVNTEIDTLEFEIDNQELNGTSGSGWWYTAFKLIVASLCGLCFTCSYDTTNSVRCWIKRKENSRQLPRSCVW